jgi:hypothetical protein
LLLLLQLHQLLLKLLPLLQLLLLLLLTNIRALMGTICEREGSPFGGPFFHDYYQRPSV